MNLQEKYIHSTNKTQYSVLLSWQQNLGIEVNEKFGLVKWKGSFTSQNIKQITAKTGHELQYNDFVDLLRKALSQKDLSCYIDILSSQDLQNLKNKKNGLSTNKTSSSKSSKRYIILTYMTKQTKFHYPISLSPLNVENSTQKLKEIYQQLRIQLQTARSSALNDTQKTQNSNQSFSINYDKKNNKNQSKVREVDQFRSQNEMLKAKLARLEEQAEKKKANIEIEAAIERTKQLKESIETANLDLVDWKNNIQDQQETQADLKKELVKLHKKICGLLVSEKEITAKKKGQQTQKELNQVRNHMKKNTNELQKLKRELQNNKNKVKELEVKAKKLNSEKEVIRKGRRGPYSSTGSVRSYNSYNSYSSGKKSYGSNASSSSKAKSNYSYNSHKYR